MTGDPSRIADPLVRWQRSHGRHDLPWQNTRDPYRVWLSEIMLQQTQVSTVMGYFDRFLQRCPDVATLAAADEDTVLGLWSGLGYYSRARNLHRCAQAVMALHGGVFPRSAQVLNTLPGIGPSTAAAIASLCFEERVAILDGNVRRVLTRVLGFAGDLSLSANEKQLWSYATAALPEVPQDMPTYTQGVMDLGAMVCVRRKPLCGVCPLAAQCVAKAQGEPERYPVKTRKLNRRAESHWVLVATQANGAVWLEQRPEKGIWARLFALPMFESREVLVAACPAVASDTLTEAPVFTHVLTHKDLHLHPVHARVSGTAGFRHAGAVHGRWVAAEEWPALGLPTPVRRLLSDLAIRGDV